MQFQEKYIISYFLTHGWKIKREGELFTYLTPPDVQNLPKDFEIEIPKDQKKIGFQKYVENLILLLVDIFPEDLNYDDLSILFSKQNSILKFRISDHDTEDGTIGFLKHIDTLDSLKKVFSQAVTFAVSQKPIFGDARFEVENYLNMCRTLQTEKGSYVTKFEIPNDTIRTTINEYKTEVINNKLFDVLDFVKEEIFLAKSPIDVDLTMNDVLASAPGQENYRLHTPAKYPRLVHANESGTIRILADAPGRFIVLRDGHVLYCGTPAECRTLYNELIGKS